MNKDIKNTIDMNLQEMKLDTKKFTILMREKDNVKKKKTRYLWKTVAVALVLCMMAMPM